MLRSCPFIVRKVLKINDCLERKALLAAVAGTVCGVSFRRTSQFKI
jgi:hypothetical protein